MELLQNMVGTMVVAGIVALVSIVLIIVVVVALVVWLLRQRRADRLHALLDDEDRDLLATLDAPAEPDDARTRDRRLDP